MDRLVSDYLGNIVDRFLVDEDGQYECYVCGETIPDFIPVLTEDGWHHQVYPICSIDCQEVMDQDRITQG